MEKSVLQAVCMLASHFCTVSWSLYTRNQEEALQITEGLEHIEIFQPCFISDIPPSPRCNAL
jgi:hypothetical protein